MTRMKERIAACTTLSTRIAVCATTALLTTPALATTGDFAALGTRFEGYVTGTGGRLAAIIAVGIGVAGSVLQFSLPKILGGIGVGAAAALGVPIATAGLTALI
jgi:conjugal transfer pilus assembly protein TraA